MMDVDELLAAPSSVGVHSTLAMTTSNVNNTVLPQTPADSNSPGLESNSIFGTLRGKGKMNYKHLFWLVFIVLAVFFGYNYFSTGTVGA